MNEDAHRSLGKNLTRTDVWPRDRAAPRRITGDHLITVRDAVAGVHQRNGLPELAARTLRGEMDHAPMMEAGLAAASAVLRGMFDG